MLAYFSSKQPFTNVTTLFGTCNIVRVIYRRESAFTNVNKEALDKILFTRATALV